MNAVFLECRMVGEFLYFTRHCVLALRVSFEDLVGSYSGGNRSTLVV